MTTRAQCAGLALLALLAAAPAHAATPIAAAPAAQPSSQPRDASLDEYRTHLQALATIVEACAKARDTKTCDPTLIGPDDRVPAGASSGNDFSRRLIRYGWLRVLLSKAQDPDQGKTKPAAKSASGAKDAPAEEAVRPAPRTTTQLLQDAEARLALDLAQVNSTAAPSAHAGERSAMQQVLAGRDFRNLEDPTAQDSALERVDAWLNRVFENAVKLSARAAWIGRALVWGFVLAVSVGLVWGLIQLERRWRIRLVPESDGPAAGAASARDWQLWLEDARQAAAAGQWRHAIHFVYWASISRLESRRLWPADRARTPREYLALVAAEDPRKPQLASLTGSFERIWYGGRSAQESDYRNAEQQASALIAGSGAAAGTAGEAAQ